MNVFTSLWRRVRGVQSRLSRRPAPRTTRPRLESLESRWAPATLSELSPLPTANSQPMAIAQAYDGSLWFTERSANKVARRSPTGVLTEYAIPTASSAPEQITASPDGYVWFTERYGKKIGRIHQSGGAIAEFKLPGYGEYATTINYTGGKVWFASVEGSSTARLGWISSTGVITKLASANTRATITSLVAGPDSNLWVTRVSSQWGDSISRVVTTGSGSWTHYKLAASSNPQGITVGSDGALWFTEANANKIGRITTTGVITEFALAAGSKPQTIVAGPDGALWFTEKGGNKIGRMTTTGVLTEYAVPTANSQPHGLTVGADGNLYFTEQVGNKLGMVTFT